MGGGSNRWVLPLQQRQHLLPLLLFLLPLILQRLLVLLQQGAEVLCGLLPHEVPLLLPSTQRLLL